MVASYYFIKPIYTVAWWTARLLRRNFSAILYCEDAMDALLYANVGKHLKKIPVVAKNRDVQAALKRIGFEAKRMPAFPDAVIMFRNMAWKFPCGVIKKIGFEHGAYNFKRFSKAQYYNLFDVFFMTSRSDVSRAHALGITTVQAVGFPKIDAAFDGSISPEDLKALSSRLGLDTKKKTLLFSATWDASGMSAVHLWYDRLSAFRDKYNIMVTLHPWVSDRYREALKRDSAIVYLDEFDVTRYIMLADVCVNDTSSLIAEFCLLDKPIVTFRLPPTPRTLPDVIELLERVSVRIDRFEELEGAVDRLLEEPAAQSRERRMAVRLFFDEPDGSAGKRAAERILEIVPQLAPNLPGSALPAD